MKELLAKHPELAAKFPQAVPEAVKEESDPHADNPIHQGDPNSPF